jgi:drug/metabolite transporter (DMT)-like permease
MPLVGVVLACLLLDESITWVVLAGGVAIAAGAWLATSRPRTKIVRTSNEGGRRWLR